MVVPLLGAPYTKQIEGKLRELRFWLEQDAMRVTYRIASDRRIVLLTVFRKSRMRATREIREQRGWTQTTLADAAGMTQSALARFEAGGTVPTLALLERITHAFHAQLVVRFDESTPAA
ncbi:helix-turn-helix domain-containing protein [Kribbella sp. NPDC051586]|uniref:helix-turn-helix domain-containing protein n=1 Tax=Kribbella sp. NPDC051586 TaxID=3364118 RepID=UPI0037B7408C